MSRRGILLTFIAVVTYCTTIASASAQSIRIIVGAEAGFERNFSKPCIGAAGLLSTEETKWENIQSRLRADSRKISFLLFGSENNVSVQTVTFSLADLRGKLQAKKAASGESAILPGVKPQRTVAQYLSLVDDLEGYDKKRLSPSSVYINWTIGQWCNFSSPTFKPPTLSQAIWSEEVMRKARMSEYLDLVAWYLRQQVGVEDSERVVPVLMHPTKFFSYDHPDEVAGFIAKLLQGHGDIQGVIGDLKKEATEVTGNTYTDPKDLQLRGAAYPTAFVRARRVGIVSGAYLAQSYEDNLHTLVHELAHYLGVPHVFTQDNVPNSGCKGKLVDKNKNSFVQSFEDPATPQAKLAELCECFYVSNGNQVRFEDYDGQIANVMDTSLAIIVWADHKYKVHYPACSAASKKYREYFARWPDSSSSNLMTYANEGDKPADQRMGMTDGQARVTNDIVRTFR
jgi:hypothetical protein